MSTHDLPDQEAALSFDDQQTFDADVDDLKKAEAEKGVKGLAGRVKFGLDPAGMMVMRDTAPLTEALAAKLGADGEKTWALIKEMHENGPWGSAERLKASEDPEIRAYIVMAAACQESGWPGYAPAAYLKDRARVIEELASFAPEKFDERKDSLVKRVTVDSVAHMPVDGQDVEVPLAEGDVALPLSVMGYKGCVSKAGEMRFAQTEKIDDAILAGEGLTLGFGEVFNPKLNDGNGGFERVSIDDERMKGARRVWVKTEETGKPISDMTPAAKRIASGYVLAYGDEKLAVSITAKAIAASEKQVGA